MANADRNEQVRILRLLSSIDGDAAAEGIILGLQSGVCGSRYQSQHSLPSPTGCGRPIGCHCLRSQGKAQIAPGCVEPAVWVYLARLSTSPAAVEALVPFVESDEYRGEVALCMCRLPLSPGVESLLQRVIVIGTDDEAALARRALSEERVVNLGEFDDAAERQRIAQTHDRAAGRVFFWVPRQDEEIPAIG